MANANSSGVFDVTMTVGGVWQLIKVSNNKVIVDEFVSVNRTASMGDSFSGMTRLRTALREAGRKFVAEGMRRLCGVPKL